MDALSETSGGALRNRFLPLFAAAVLGTGILMSGVFHGGVAVLLSGLWGLAGIVLSGAVWSIPCEHNGTRSRMFWTALYCLITTEFLRKPVFWGWLFGAVYLAFFYVCAASVICIFRPKAGAFGAAAFALVGFFRIELLAGPGRSFASPDGVPLPSAAGLAFPLCDPIYALAAFPPLYGAAWIAGTVPLVFAFAFCGTAVWRRGNAVNASPLVLSAVFLAVIAAAAANPARDVFSRGDISAVIVQGGVSSEQVADALAGAAGESALLSRYRSLTELAQTENPDVYRSATLVVWPESSWPGFIDPAEPPPYPEWLGGAPLVAGGYSYRRVNGTDVVGNTAVLLTPEGASLRDKVVLAPFGEYSPWFLGMVSPAGDAVDMTPGEWSLMPLKLVSPAGPILLGTLVCYEDSFPGRLAAEAECGAELLVVITNDGWFRGTSGPWQHAAAIRVRAAEARLPVLRAGNVAPSCIIDADGGIRAWLGKGGGVLTGTVPHRGCPRPQKVGLAGWAMLWLLAFWAAIEALSAPKFPERQDAEAASPS